MLALSLLVLVGGLNPAAAGYRRVQDPDDLEARVDVKWASHGHVKGGEALRHALGTYGRWRGRALRSYRARIDFNLDKDGAAERQLRVRYRDGRLRAKMYRGELFGVEVPGRVKVRRANRRSMSVTFAPGMLRENLARYRWSLLVYLDATCPGSCPSDSAPNRGWVKHRL
jgi:hypothetical protein